MYLVYTTFASMQEAQELAQYMVEQKLAACANIIPHIFSIYHWQGVLEKSEECLCFFKTSQEVFPALKETLENMHSYEVPCIVAMPLSEISTAYGAWLKEHILEPTQLSMNANSNKG